MMWEDGDSRLMTTISKQSYLEELARRAAETFMDVYMAQDWNNYEEFKRALTAIIVKELNPLLELVN